MDNVMFLTGQILKRQNKYIFPPIVNSCMIEIIFSVKHIFEILFRRQNSQNEVRFQPNRSPNSLTPPTSNVPQWPVRSPAAGCRYISVLRRRRNAVEAAAPGRYCSGCSYKSRWRRTCGSCGC